MNVGARHVEFAIPSDFDYFPWLFPVVFIEGVWFPGVVFIGRIVPVIAPLFVQRLSREVCPRAFDVAKYWFQNSD